MTAARVLATPRGELFPLAENEVGKNEIHFAEMRVLTAHARQTARISFLDTLSLFKDSQCARKLETRTQYKADGVCFPIHPAAELVGWHSSILVDPFFARGLAICYDEISLPDRISNQIQNQHLLLWGFFTHDFNCVCQSTRRATILLRLSSRCDRPRSVYQSRAFSAGFLDPQECPIQTSGGGAIGLNPVPVVPQWLAKDDAG